MTNTQNPRRLRFPDDEQKQPWLPLLLEAYAIVDAGIASAIRGEEQRRGAGLACAKGCSSCCVSHPDIPVFPLELVGIYWHVIEKSEGPLRSRLKQKLFSTGHGDPCPFMIEDACSIHPFRPLACRHLNVFGARCGPDEDAFHTRRGDVLIPPREITDRAFAVMLPFYGITDRKAIEHAVRTRMLDSLARILQHCPWSELALRMQEFELKRS